MSLLIQKKVKYIPHGRCHMVLSQGRDSEWTVNLVVWGDGGQVRLSPLLFPAVVPDGKPE